MLRALHEGQIYKRIVIASHSLGTILAVDLLSYFWAERESARTVRQGTKEFGALCALERAADRVTSLNGESLAVYFDAQRALRQLLARRPAPVDARQADSRWLISDLVTFGSPLAHAEFLLASSPADLKSRIAARELPQSPPFRETLDADVLARAEATHAMPIATPPEATRLMSYPLVDSPDAWRLHHAAPFAVVRWTNVFDPAFLVLCGDVISGPIAPVFGPAIVDIDLKKRRGGRQSWSFTHTKYWSLDEAPRIDACREAVNLLDAPAPVAKR